MSFLAYIFQNLAIKKKGSLRRLDFIRAIKANLNEFYSKGPSIVIVPLRVFRTKFFLIIFLYSFIDIYLYVLRPTYRNHNLKMNFNSSFKNNKVI